MVMRVAFYFSFSPHSVVRCADNLGDKLALELPRQPSPPFSPVYHPASNPGPHHFDLLDLREEGLGKLPAIFGFLPRFQGKI